MADIDLNDDQEYAHPILVRQPSWLSRAVMSTGLAKDEAAAQKILLVIVALACIGIVFTLFSSDTASKPPTPSIDGSIPR